MRTRETMTVSLPPEMIEQVERVRKQESRTKSELVREALRRYFANRAPMETPSAADREALRRGRAEYARGKYVTLDELSRAVETPRRKVRRKGTR